MTTPPEHPATKPHIVPAMVFASLLPGELRIILYPGDLHVDGGIPRDVPREAIPPELRVPNTRIWLELDERHEIVRAWRRDERTPEEMPVLEDQEPLTPEETGRSDQRESILRRLLKRMGLRR